MGIKQVSEKPKPAMEAWRSCICPLFANQDGICGCPEFWERKASHHDGPSATEFTTRLSNIEINRLRSPSPTPAGPPQETCFFWYHGNCRRGSECNLAHESHVTWPMENPPGFVHFEACKLPLCSLREDLVALQKVRKQKEDSCQVGGQVDEAVVSCASRRSFGKHDAQTVGVSLDVSNKRADTPPRPNSSGIAGAVKVTAAPEPGPANFLNNTTSISQPPPSDNMEYIEINGPSPPASLYDTDGEDGGVLLSLSHEGTLRKSSRKRKRAQSPTEQGEEETRAKREPTPDLSGYPSILERKRRMNHWDLKLVKVGCRHNLATPVPVTAEAKPVTFGSFHIPPKTVPLSPYPNHLLPSRPVSGGADNLKISRSLPRKVREIPTGPRALGGKTPICFYWYHKGYCRPRNKYYQVIRCTYAHTLDVPHAQVSLPPGVTDHNPSCSLPLCPVRMQDSVETSRNTDGINQEGEVSQSHGGIGTLSAEPELSVKDEPHTPPRFDTALFNTDHLFPMRGDGTPMAMYGKITGVPLKTQDIGVSPGGENDAPSRDASGEMHESVEEQPFYIDLQSQPLPELTAVDERTCEDYIGTKRAQKTKREARKEKKEEKRRKRQAEIVSRLFSKLDDDPPKSAIHNGLSIRAKRGKSGNLLRSKRAQSLFEADDANGGRVETFDAEAELYRESFHPIAGLPDRSILLDVRDEREEKAQGVTNAMNLIQTLNQNPYKYHPMMLKQPAVMVREENEVEGYDNAVVEHEHLDWDTDLVRRLFGGNE